MSDFDQYLIRHSCRYQPPERRVLPCEGCALERAIRCDECPDASAEPGYETPCSVCGFWPERPESPREKVPPAPVSGSLQD